MGNYCTYQDIEQYLETTLEASKQALLTNQIIPAVSRLIDQFTGFRLGWDRQPSVQEEGYGWIRDQYVYFAVHKPIINSISQLKYRNGSTWYTADSVEVEGDYWAKGRTTLYYGKTKCQIIYDGGYATIPPQIKHATAVVSIRVMKSAPAGFSDVIGADQFGNLIYAKLFPREVQMILSGKQRRALG